MTIDPTALAASVTETGTAVGGVFANLLTVSPLILTVAGFSIVFGLVAKKLSLKR